MGNLNLDKIIRKSDGYYKYVAPDGGWAYMVSFAAAVIMAVTEGLSFGYVVINNDLIETLGLTSTQISICNGIFMASVSLAGFAAPIALRKYSIRQIGFIGAICFSGAFLAGAFVQTPIQYILAFGVFMGVGIGSMYNMVFASFNTYFDKKKALFNSLNQAFVGIAMVSGPHIVNYWKRNLGIQDTLIINGGIALHILLGFAIHQPVDKHLKLEKLTHLELMEYEENMDLNKPPKNLEQKQEYLSHYENGKVKKSVISRLAVFLNFSLYKDPRFAIISLGLAVISFADTTFLIFFPIYLYSVNWTSTDVAIVISISNTGDVISRIILVVISKLLRVKSTTIVYFGAWLSVTVRFVMPSLSGVINMSTASLIWGFSRGILISFSPLVLAEYLPVDKYPAGQGLTALTGGMFGIITAPLLGILYNVTNTHWMNLHLLTLMMIFVCIVPWSAEMIILMRRQMNKPLLV